MKICYIADALSIHTQRWVKYFTDRGYEAHLISPTPLGDGNIGNAELCILKRFLLQIRVISFSINLLLYVIQIKQLIRKIKPDILHAHYIADCGFLGALSGFHPLALTTMGSDVLVKPVKSRIIRSIAEFTLKRADLITTPGENLIEKIIKLGGDPNKIHLINNGVDTKQFKPRDKSSEKEPTTFDSPVVISIRNLKPIYDLETLIRSVPLVLNKVPEVKFIIVGDGTQKNYLKDLAKSLDVLESISFTGRIPHDQLPNYLSAADIYISTSLSDGGPSISLVEAMACGLAPVVTNVGNTKEWIKDGESGFVIPTRRPDLLADKIVYLLENKELRQKMGKANFHLVEQRADYEKEMEKMERVYVELIKKFKR